MRLTPRSFRQLNSYAIAAAVSLVALVLQWVLRIWTGDRIPYMFILPAMVFVAATLGRGPAIVVMASGALNAILMAPGADRSTTRAGEDAATLLAYVALGTFIVVYGSRLRMTTARAAQAERRLSIAQEETGVGVFELDFVAGKAFVTPTLCQMLGRPRMNGPIALDRWLSGLHPDQVRESRRVLQEQVDRGELRYEREQRIPLVNGDVRWVLNRVSIDVTRDGKLAQARGATVDITQRKRLDELLRDAQAKLRQQVDDLQRLHDFAQRLVTSRDDAKAPLQALVDLVTELCASEHGLLWLVDECAPGTTGFTGFAVLARRGLAPQLALDLLPPVEEGGESRASQAGVTGTGLDASQCEQALLAHRAAATRAGFGSVHSTPLRSSSGGVIGFISVLFTQPHDIGERELRLGEVLAATATALVERDLARAAATATERRFSVALESSIVPFTIVAPRRDAAGHIADFEWVYINASAALALGVDAAAAVGKPVSEAVSPSWLSSDIFARYVRVVERGESCDFEARSVTGLQDRWLHVTASPLQGSVAIWFADITEHKRQQKDLLDADRRKDEFLATLAHELRNPLAPIRQAVLVSRSAASSPEQKRWGFDVIDRQVKNMATLLDDLLDVSRITRGTLKLQRATVKLSDIVEAALETARPHIDAKKHRLSVDIRGAERGVDVDALRMSQVISNLLTNAAKYTDPGGLIRLSANSGPEGMEIRIADDGVGLTPDQFDRLFEMFAQMPASAGRSQGGLGIGLALARGILELHGGRISVSSPGPGLGSEFVVRLPAACSADGSAPETAQEIDQEPDGEAGAPTSTSTAAEAAVKSRRVIVADDNVDAAESLAEMLRLDGHDVHVCFDGEHALAEFRRFRPDVALLDVGMPLLSGLEVASAIRSLLSGHDATLIAVTGWGQLRDQERALVAGFDHHMTKPVHPERIRALIASARA